MAEDRVWMLAETRQLQYGMFFCWGCKMVRSDPFMTPRCWLCGVCHREMTEQVMVKLVWSHDCSSGEFTWAGVGAGKVRQNTDNTWIVRGGKFSASDPRWWVALFQWAISAGYKGPDPFNVRHDWAYTIEPKPADQTDTQEIIPEVEVPA